MILLPSTRAMPHCLVMTPSLTDTLCTRCGLCCNGTLFADVELASRKEATGLELLGLEIDDDSDAPLLVLPCAALRGTRCSIYTHRPNCCRTFECRLLQETRRGVVSAERAIERIADTREHIERVNHLLARLGRRDRNAPLKERCAEALASENPAGPAPDRIRAELEIAMTSVEAMIKQSFL